MAFDDMLLDPLIHVKLLGRVFLRVNGSEEEAALLGTYNDPLPTHESSSRPQTHLMRASILRGLIKRSCRCMYALLVLLEAQRNQKEQIAPSPSEAALEWLMLEGSCEDCSLRARETQKR